jgi:pimeloyl-ACP methyl ester carboxylesterase
MKTIHYILIFLLVGASNLGLAQIDPEVKTLNKALQDDPQLLDNTFRPKIDSVAHDWTNGLRDDTALYYNVNRSGSRGEDTSQRLIFFLHGLGGSGVSWKGSYLKLSDEYQFFAAKPDYNTDQNSFVNASHEVKQQLQLKRILYLDNDTAHNAFNYTDQPPYIIGHSQGGLVARDMDMKWDTSSIDLPGDGTFNSRNREFHGIITFGTPHAGSFFAVKQNEIASFAGELSSALINQEVATLFNDKLKFPIFQSKIKGIRDSMYQLTNYIGRDLIPNIAKVVAAGQNSLISKQYGPTSTYLVDTLNTFSNPRMAKGLFYGVEQNPVIWRISKFMIKDPGEQLPFTANEDDSIVTVIEDIRLKAMVNASINRGLRNISNSRVNYWKSTWFWRLNPIAVWQVSKHRKDAEGYQDTYFASDRVNTLLQKANMQYKAILGAYDDSNFITQVTHKECRRTVKIYRKRLYNNNYVYLNSVTTHSRIPVGSSCGPGYTQNYKINNRWRKRVVSYVSTPIYNRTLIEIPSDGAVLKPSQMAFPGCNDDFKVAMDEIWNNQTKSFIYVGNKVNHMQMRNCLQTEAALRKVFEADGTEMDRFFQLYRTQ